MLRSFKSPSLLDESMDESFQYLVFSPHFRYCLYNYTSSHTCLVMGSSSSLPYWNDLIPKVALKLPIIKDAAVKNAHLQESFPFFDLPDVVIRKILKEYVPVSDKACVLSQIEDFQPYLALNSMWYQPTLTLYRCMKGLESGWYIAPRDPYNWYYVSVDYFNLTLTVRSFCILFKDSTTLRCVKIRHFSCSEVESFLQSFRNLNVIHVHEQSILVYRLKVERILPTVCWIVVQENIVYWRNSCNPYLLEQNKCFIPKWDVSHDHGITLTLESDRTVVINCNVSSDQKCDNEINIRLRPISFQLCDHPFPAPACGKSSDILHAFSIVTFSNFEKRQVIMTCKRCDWGFYS